MTFPATFLSVAVGLGLLMTAGAAVNFVVLLVRDLRSKSLW